MISGFSHQTSGKRNEKRGVQRIDVDPTSARKRLTEISDDSLVARLREDGYVSDSITQSFTFSPIDKRPTRDGIAHLTFNDERDDQLVFAKKVNSGLLMINVPTKKNKPPAVFSEGSSVNLYGPNGDKTELSTGETQALCSLDDVCSFIICSCCLAYYVFEFNVEICVDPNCNESICLPSISCQWASCF